MRELEHRNVEKTFKVFSTIEEARNIVREFWTAMRVSESGERFTESELNNLTNEDFDETLTWIDRTVIKKADPRVHKESGWVVLFMANNQPLSKEAVSWLKGKGYV